MVKPAYSPWPHFVRVRARLLAAASPLTPDGNGVREPRSPAKALSLEEAIEIVEVIVHLARRHGAFLLEGCCDALPIARGKAHHVMSAFAEFPYFQATRLVQ